MTHGEKIFREERGEDQCYRVPRIFLLIAHCLLLSTFLSSCSSVPTDARHGAMSGRAYAVASWYGREFHGKPTASGEIFNMYSKTCAHREYPFGTRVKITNTENNLSSECVVNDRGPFVEGRDIDLSFAAAKDISMLGQGTARVLLEVNGRDTSYVRRVTVKTSAGTGPFVIQVGSFTESINAVRLKVALKMKYSNVYIQEIEVKGATYYRVRIGSYKDYKNALSVAEQLGQEGYQAILLRADTNI